MEAFLIFLLIQVLNKGSGAKKFCQPGQVNHGRIRIDSLIEIDRNLLYSMICNTVLIVQKEKAVVNDFEKAYSNLL